MAGEEEGIAAPRLIASSPRWRGAGAKPKKQNFGVHQQDGAARLSI
jgi:hypothetical protein